MAKLIAFVESLPIEPQADLAAQLANIASFSDIAVEAKINDLDDKNPPIRLSGLLAVPGSNAAPRPAPPGAAARNIPVPMQLVELFRIDANGDNILPRIESATTNSKGVFTHAIADRRQPVG